jgi:signal transduction histidine kinase/ligand-binding sensor domain-containing protein
MASVLVLVAVVTVYGLEPSTPLANYGRQSWVMENGLPQNTVQALAQTTDGFIWLGTEVGLVRFDGNSFAVFDKNSSPALPGNDVRCLLAAKDGALWIGTSEGLARWKDGTAKTFTTKDGLPGDVIRSLHEDDRGAVLVSTESGEIAVDGERVVPILYDKLQGQPVGFTVDLADRSHVFINKSEVELTYGGRKQRWVVGKDLPGNRLQVAQADRECSLWIGTNGGLVRWAAGKLEKLPVTDPLATASILAMMEDREGNLWVGTESGGLHILRDQRFRTIGAHDGLSSDSTTAVVEDASGRLWVGTSGFGLNEILRPNDAALESHPSHKDKDMARAGHPAFNPSGSGPVLTYTVRDGLLSDIILSLAAAPNGDLWVGTPDGLSRIRRGQIDSFTSADGLPDDFIRSLLADSDGSLWIGTRHGLTHWLGARTGSTASAQMKTFTHADGLGSDLVGAMTRDSGGDLWVATYAGLSRLRGDAKSGYTESNYTVKDGLTGNVITALHAEENGWLLIGTQDRGWNIWDGHSFGLRPDSRNALEKSNIHAILDDGRYHLWFATGDGIAMCGRLTIGTCGHMIEFGVADGLRSRETAINSHPSAWRSRDGHLWFATPKGLVEVDPAHFPMNEIVPPVALERFTVDDHAQALNGDGSALKVAAGHVHFEFDYAALSFVAPQKVRYRFMLDGFDRGWTEAGARRTAYYTNIPPGRYTFRVQAANNDGLWNTQGAALAFELRPHFYQTVWFYLLLAAFAGALIVLLLRRRLGVAQREFAAVLGERNRIAREIHDTLAQGYAGISLQLELLAELLRHHKVDAAQTQLDTTRGYVRQGLADARQSIWALRSQDSAENTLPVLLRRMVEADPGQGIESSFNVFGAYRPLPPGTEREILRIAQEAIHNVKKHAGARHLAVQLAYDSGQITLEVRDDGRGFDAGPDSAPGHYGLTGMRERAAAIGATLQITGEPGAGATVQLRVPAPLDRTGEPA